MTLVSKLPNACSTRECCVGACRRDGISQEVETQLRIYGCELIQEGGILLKLPQAVMATGQVLLHRFYCKESMLKFNIKVVPLSRAGSAILQHL